jgi:diacylglycerol O-acyltransferase
MNRAPEGRAAEDGKVGMERLSGMDALFLYAESPTQHMHVTMVAVLDPSAMPGGYSFERVRDHIASRVHLIPAFMRRLVPVPLGLHHPLWVDDPDFELEYHVRRAALPHPGDDHQLAPFAAQIAGIPLDRARPLWEIWMVEELEHGRVAMVAKVHHAALDGVAGVESLVTLFDLERDAPVTTAPPRPTTETIPSDIELLTYGAVSKVKGVLDILPLARRTAGSVLAVRNRRAEANEQRDRPRSWAPRTPFNGTISGNRKVAFARASLSDIKAARSAVPGATVNDVILTVCAGALRQYLDDRGELPLDPLLAACPINVRTEDQQGRSDNRVSAMVTWLPTHIADPLERLAATHAATLEAKDEHALIGASTAQEWAELLDPNLLRWASGAYASSGVADRHRPVCSVMISNLPGPPFSLYLAGAELERAYPMGQVIEGVGLNITMMSYRDSVDFGFMAAANLVPDVGALAGLIESAATELVKAASERGPA